MRTGYVLECLDNLITVTLNPVKWQPGQLVHDDITVLQNLVSKEKAKVELIIKSTVFNLNNKLKIKCSIRKYHSSLISLLDQALENQARASKKLLLQKVCDTVIENIEELLSLIESRFTIYLSKNERVPATYLKRVKKELLKKLSAISRKMDGRRTTYPAFDIMMKELEVFLGFSPPEHSFAYRDIFYIKDLCRDLQGLEICQAGAVYSSLDELLIRMNFNSKTYINNLTKRISEYANAATLPSEKMERLLLQLKLIKQFYKKPNLIFDSKNSNLHKQIENWFSQEIFYLETQLRYSILPAKASEQIPVSKNHVKQKITCILSVDQLALILRAGDDLRIIMAKSLSSVFKTITPHLSTPQKDDISFDSMRSKSYSAELRDKEVVIQTLRQMIKRIEEY